MDDYTGPDSGFEIVPNDRNFMYSSVEPDFKVLPTTAGVAAVWHDFATGHGPDGTQLWRYEAEPLHNKLAITPDGRHVTTLTRTGRLLVFDAATGDVVYSRQLVDGYATRFEVLADGNLCVLRDGELHLFDPAGEPVHSHRPYEDTDARNVVPLAGPYAGQVVTGDERGNWARIDPRTGEQLAVLVPADDERWRYLLGTWASPIVVRDDHSELAVLDPADMSVAERIPCTGLEGVKRQSQAASTATSYTAWEPRAALSFDGSLLLVIDQGGLARLFDAHSGEALRRFPHSLLDHPYDFTWLGEPGEFVAITDGGKLVRARVDGTEPIWTTEVFTAADRDRFYRDISDWAETVDAAKVVELCTTLATTKSIIEYCDVADRLARGPALDDVAAALTSSHIYGLMRSCYWMLPTGGFAEYEELRQLRPRIDQAAAQRSPEYRDAAGRLGWLLDAGDVPLAQGDDWIDRLGWWRPLEPLAESQPDEGGDEAGQRAVEIIHAGLACRRVHDLLRHSSHLSEPLFNLVSKLPYGATLLLLDCAMSPSTEQRTQIADVLRHRFGGPEIESFIASVVQPSGGVHDLAHGAFPHAIARIEQVLYPQFGWRLDTDLAKLNSIFASTLSAADIDADGDLTFTDLPDKPWYFTMERDTGRIDRFYHNFRPQDVSGEDEAEMVRVLDQRWGTHAEDGSGRKVWTLQGGTRVRLRVFDDDSVALTVIAEK